MVIFAIAQLVSLVIPCRRLVDRPISFSARIISRIACTLDWGHGRVLACNNNDKDDNTSVGQMSVTLE